MSPRRPPPLPKSLFTGQGALAPGSAQPSPDPATIHPSHLVDAHSFPIAGSSNEIYDSLPASYPRPKVKGVVQVKMDVSAGPAPSVHGLKPFSIHPTILNLTLVTPPSITNIAKGAVDIIIPSTQPMTEREWDLLEEAVNALDGSWGAPESSKGGGRIVISGILPPPLTLPSGALANSDSYNLHLARLASLSLHSNVFLKALPPVVESERESWYEDEKELDRVIRMYLAPAIETFGFHRLVFGSSPALPKSHLTRRTRSTVDLMYPCSPNEWYATLRNNLVSLGTDQEGVQGMMCNNAVRVYQFDP